ncbi:MAG: hypothetical protein B7Y41_00430 [Hydrogenophilales bacterium 28-61-23]|nr:MAG: hypothetical protein B7Y41_00430 [Hydrogenophilales bacterium 28-61-23]
MRKYLVVFMLLLLPVAPATAQISVGFGFSDGNIGISLQLYPELEQVPGYPVYYAPRLDSNYFFYDGMYWVYQRDDWYASSWYNGPWWRVDPEDVPYYVLRIPVRYYRQPPMYFQGWQVNAPPRWGDHWGNAWAQRRSGWDRWDRNSAPAPAPLPVYQRKYSGDRYPGAEQQRTLNKREYRYQPHESVVRQLVQKPLVQKPQAQGAPAPVRRETPGTPQMRNPARQDAQRANPPPSAQKSAPTPPRAQSRQQIEDKVRPTPAQDRQQNRQPRNEATQRQPPESRPREAVPQGKAAPQESKRQQKPGKEKDRKNADDRGQGHGR